MIKYVSIEDYTENDVLPGALSTESTFSVLNRGKNDLDIVNLKDHVSNEYAEDIMNKLFVSHDGVVANAFDLKFFDENTNRIYNKEKLYENKIYFWNGIVLHDGPRLYLLQQ